MNSRQENRPTYVTATSEPAERTDRSARILVATASTGSASVARALLTLSIRFRFSHDRRLEVFVLLVFFLVVIIVIIGISRWHFVAHDGEETPLDRRSRNTFKGTQGSCRFLFDVATFKVGCYRGEFAVGQIWSTRWRHINSTSVRS